MKLRSGLDYTIPEDDDAISTMVTAPDQAERILLSGLETVGKATYAIFSPYVRRLYTIREPPLLLGGGADIVPMDDHLVSTVDTTPDQAERILLGGLETMGRAAYKALCPFVRWAYTIPEPFPFLALPPNIRSQIYKHALSTHTDVRIVNFSITSTPHPLLQVSVRVRREVLKVAEEDCAVHIACELASLSATELFIHSLEKVGPHQGRKLHLRVYAGGFLSRRPEMCEKWAEQWRRSVASTQFKHVSVDIDFLPDFSIGEWSKWDWLEYTLLAIRDGVHALQDSGVLELAVDVAKAVNESWGSDAGAVGGPSDDEMFEQGDASSSDEMARAEVDVPVRTASVKASTRRR